MALDHFSRDPLDDPHEIKTPLVGGDLRIEDDLQQEVAKLFDNRLVVLGVDGFEQLVSLFERVRLDRFERLHAVPRATGRRPQPSDNFAELAERRPHAVRIGWPAGLASGWRWFV